LSSLTVKGELKIYDSMGALILAKQINNKSELQNIDVTRMSDGLYVCHFIQNDSDKIIGRFTIIH
jgi:hypothetical protein